MIHRRVTAISPRPEHVAEFLERLPEIRRQLSLDVRAAYDGDPAAHHTDEAVICYPGIRPSPCTGSRTNCIDSVCR